MYLTGGFITENFIFFGSFQTKMTNQGIEGANLSIGQQDYINNYE